MEGIGFHSWNKWYQPLWLYKCDCGKEFIACKYKVQSKHTKSCGCLKQLHGDHKRVEYAAWRNMRYRCSNQKSLDWKDYGGRGIQVCARWQKYHFFKQDMGPRPNGYSLDRIDNNGDYTPSNCRWATPVQQRNNRRDKSF